MSRDAAASSLSVYSGDLITVSRLNETSSGSSPVIPAPAAFLLLPLMLNATIGGVLQSYTRSPPVAGLCLGVSSASSTLAQAWAGSRSSLACQGSGDVGTLSVSYILSPWSVYGDFVG